MSGLPFEDLAPPVTRPELRELNGSENQVRWATDIRETLLAELYARLEERRKLGRIAGERGNTAQAETCAAKVRAYADAIAHLEETTTAGFFINVWTKQENRLGVKIRTRETKREVRDAVIGELTTERR